jgi:hypothetical protein
MEAFIFVAGVVVVWCALIGGALLAIFRSTRYIFRQANVRWPMPAKTWPLLATGLVTQWVGSLVLGVALLIFMLSLDLPFVQVIQPALTLGFLTIDLGTVILVAWLSWVIRTQGRAQLFGETRWRASTSLGLVGMGAGGIGFLTGIYFGVWPVGISAGISLALYLVCLASLLAHSSEWPK